MPEKKPCRIIIDIPDTTGFGWDRARQLWGGSSNFSGSNQGYNTSPSYVWYKVNPDTNVPLEKIEIKHAKELMLPMPSTEPACIVPIPTKHLQTQINQLAREVYRLKSAKEPITQSKRNILNRDIIDLRATYELLQEVPS